jgi:hypothetical protein
MKNAIIDNSTLSSVERVIGEVPVLPNYDLSGDLSAYDSYLSSLIFYDDVIRVDDYKEEHSERRSKNFSELDTIKFENNSYNDFVDAARILSQGAMLSIKAGDVENNEIGNFLKDLDLHVSPAWIMQSSDFFLRIRLLSDHTGVELEKYTPLMTAIFDQLSENKNAGKSPDWSRRLLDSQGRPIQTISRLSEDHSHVIGSDVKAFAAGLNWLSLRSIFYALVAEKLDAVAVCHPIRNDYLARFFVDKLNKIRPDQRRALLNEFQNTTSKLVGSSNSLIGESAFSVNTPLISAWATLKAGSPREAKNFVNDVRNSPEAKAMRIRLREIEWLIKSGEMLEGRKNSRSLFKDYEILSGIFFRKYAVGSEDPYGISVNLIGMSGSFKLSAVKDRVSSMFPNRSKSLALLRNISRDLLQSPSLGHVSDLLRSSRQIEGDEWDVGYSPKVDPIRFRHVRASWKKPMW